MYDNGIVATLPLNILHFANHLTYSNGFYWNFVFGPRKEIEMPDFPGFTSLYNHNNERFLCQMSMNSFLGYRSEQKMDELKNARSIKNFDKDCRTSSTTSTALL